MNERVGRNDPCPCGSGKKFKKCHANVARGGHSAPPLDARLAALAHVILDTLEGVATEIELDHTDLPRRFRQVCAYFHASMLHGALKTTLADLQGGCGLFAFNYQRFIFEYWLAAHYYEKFPTEAELFVASMPLVQKRLADKWADLKPIVAKNIDIPALDAIVADSLKNFPALRRPKGKSGSSKSPIMIDWSPPETCDMAIAFIKAEGKDNPSLIAWVRQEYSIDPAIADEEALEKFAREKYQVNCEFPSQYIHATAFSLVTMLRLDAPTRFGRFSTHFPNTNGLLCGWLDLALGVTESLGRVGAVDVKPRLEHLKTALQVERVRFGATEGM